MTLLGWIKKFPFSSIGLISELFDQPTYFVTRTITIYCDNMPAKIWLNALIIASRDTLYILRILLDTCINTLKELNTE